MGKKVTTEEMVDYHKRKLYDEMYPDRGKPNFFQKLLQSDAYWENLDLIDRSINTFGYLDLERKEAENFGFLTRDERIPSKIPSKIKTSKDYPKKPDHKLKGPNAVDIMKWLAQDRISRPRQIGDTDWGVNLFFDQPMPGDFGSEDSPPVKQDVGITFTKRFR